jgi:hypothetical protein
VGWRSLQGWTLGVAQDLVLSHESAVRRNCGARPVGRKGLREFAMVALFGNYGLTLERAVDRYRAIAIYATIAT